MHNQAVRKAFRILKAEFGILANKPQLIPDLFFSVAFESLLTDFHRLEPIEFTENLDFNIIIQEQPDIPLDVTIEADSISLTGPILKATEQTSDLRFTLFGNEGLLFRYILMFMEKKYDTYSFHACSLYDPEQNHMYIAPGGAGAGKTCLILKALELGLKIFATEMTHFSFEKGLTLYKGSLVDNIRIGNLKYSYPTVPEKLGLTLPETKDEWGIKIPVDLSAEQTEFDTISETKITFVLPHIEEDRAECIATDIKDKRIARKALFDNLSDKIAANVVLYDQLIISGLDNPGLAKKRLDAVGKLLEKVNRVVKVIAGSRNCWDRILER